MTAERGVAAASALLSVVRPCSRLGSLVDFADLGDADFSSQGREGQRQRSEFAVSVSGYAFQSEHISGLPGSVFPVFSDCSPGLWEIGSCEMGRFARFGHFCYARTSASTAAERTQPPRRSGGKEHRHPWWHLPRGRDSVSPASPLDYGGPGSRENRDGSEIPQACLLLSSRLWRREPRAGAGVGRGRGQTRRRSTRRARVRRGSRRRRGKGVDESD